MKSILISIQPQWVEKILNREKTIEIRKTKPNIELPCKVYIYMTKKRNFFMANRKGEEIWFGDGLRYDKTEIVKFPKCDVQYWHLLGKVVAEFTLNEIETLWQNNKNKTSTATVVDKAIFEKQTCMTWEQYCEYHKCKNGKYPNSYAWHIEDLKIYDKPKELSEFTHNVPNYSNGVVMYSLKKEPLKRPFQSWGYVNGTDN